LDAFDFGGEAGQAPNREELLKMAIRTAQSGNNEAARVMFREVLKSDRRNERALMWMAKLAADKEERQQWLQRVLQVNPNNETARQTLYKMQYSRSARDNRVLLVFGVIAGVLVIVALIVVVFAITNGGA
jgi:Tfp pilus assembly protein PilF